MSVDFRRATADDLAALETLLHAFTVEDLHPWDPGVVAAAAGLMERPHYGIVVVAHDAARLVGYAVLCLNWSLEARGLEALVDEIYVEPSQRGDGIGTAFMAYLADEARQRGATRMYLEVEAHNVRAAALYERLGFRTEDSRWMQLELS